MADIVVTPNMNLPNPSPSVAPGPDWASYLYACMVSIDEHDHTSGKGVPLSSDSITVSSSLPLNNNLLTSVKGVVFTAQPSLVTQQAVYVSGVDLYYNDGNG